MSCTGLPARGVLPWTGEGDPGVGGAPGVGEGHLESGRSGTHYTRDGAWDTASECILHTHTHTHTRTQYMQSVWFLQIFLKWLPIACYL